MFGKKSELQVQVETEYPFHKLTAQGHNYTNKEKVDQFIR